MLPGSKFSCVAAAGGAATSFLRELRNLECLAIDGCWLAPGCELLILRDGSHISQVQVGHSAELLLCTGLLLRFEIKIEFN